MKSQTRHYPFPHPGWRRLRNTRSSSDSAVFPKEKTIRKPTLRWPNGRTWWTKMSPYDRDPSVCPEGIGVGKNKLGHVHIETDLLYLKAEKARWQLNPVTEKMFLCVVSTENDKPTARSNRKSLRLATMAATHRDSQTYHLSLQSTITTRISEHGLPDR